MSRLHLVLLAAGLAVPTGCSASGGGAAGGSSPDGGAGVKPAPDAAAHAPDGSSGIDGDAPPAADGGGEAAPGAGAGDAAGDAAGDGSTIPPVPGWTLTWHDEFDLPDGSPADPARWTQETGNSGWGNNHERQYYTPGTANAVIQGGSLVITATPQGASKLQCQYGTCEYTSARMNTSGKFEQQYGRFEARIQLPTGQGIWPAWWLLGNDIGTVSWPQCGEIDVMENIGSTPSTNYGSLHGPGYSGGQDLTGSYSLPGGALLSADYHLFAVEWDASSIRVLRRRRQLRDAHPGGRPRRRQVGLRPPVLRHPQRRRRRLLAGRSRLHHPLPPDDAGRLRARVHEVAMTARAAALLTQQAERD